MNKKSKIPTDSIIINGVSFFAIGLIAIVSRTLNISFFFLFMSLAAVAWVIMHFYEKSLLKDLGDEQPAIYCEWENRLNETDFRFSQFTVRDLTDLGFTPETALGKSFVFHTEPSLDCPDYYFEGMIMKDQSGEYFIKSTEDIRVHQDFSNI